MSERARFLASPPRLGASPLCISDVYKYAYEMYKPEDTFIKHCGNYCTLLVAWMVNSRRLFKKPLWFQIWAAVRHNPFWPSVCMNVPQNGPKMIQSGPPLQMHFRRTEIKDKSTCTSFKQTYADPDLTFTLNFKFVLSEFWASLR